MMSLSIEFDAIIEEQGGNAARMVFRCESGTENKGTGIILAG